MLHFTVEQTVGKNILMNKTENMDMIKICVIKASWEKTTRKLTSEIWFFGNHRSFIAKNLQHWTVLFSTLLNELQFAMEKDKKRNKEGHSTLLNFTDFSWILHYQLIFGQLRLLSKKFFVNWLKIHLLKSTKIYWNIVVFTEVEELFHLVIVYQRAYNEKGKLLSHCCKCNHTLINWTNSLNMSTSWTIPFKFRWVLFSKFIGNT